MVQTVGHKRELEPIRRQLFPVDLPKPKHKIKKRSKIHKNEVVNAWCTLFPGPDGPAMLRSQRYSHEVNHKRPVQIRTYMQQPNFGVAIGTILIGGLLTLLAPFRCRRYLLQRVRPSS